MNMEHARLVLESCRSGKDVIEEIWKMEENVQLNIFVFMWRWWSARNEGDRMPSNAEICSSVTYYLLELAKLNLQGKENKQLKQQAWKPPQDELYKISVDAAFNTKTKKGGWGFIVRNSHGEFLDGGAGNIVRAACPLHAEALAALWSLQRAA
jgi:hypothetical protein